LQGAALAGQPGSQSQHILSLAPHLAANRASTPPRSGRALTTPVSCARTAIIAQATPRPPTTCAGQFPLVSRCHLPWHTAAAAAAAAAASPHAPLNNALLPTLVAGYKEKNRTSTTYDRAEITPCGKGEVAYWTGSTRTPVGKPQECQGCTANTYAPRTGAPPPALYRLGFRGPPKFSVCCPERVREQMRAACSPCRTAVPSSFPRRWTSCTQAWRPACPANQAPTPPRVWARCPATTSAPHAAAMGTARLPAPGGPLSLLRAARAAGQHVPYPQPASRLHLAL